MPTDPPTNPDDNPFARHSIWPKMPQAPHRVASLPRPPEPPQRTITPVFVRSTEAVVPAFTRPAPAPPSVRPSPPVVQPPPIVAAAEAPFVAPTPRATAPPKSAIWPGLIAAAVGLAGVAGLFVLLTRDEPAPQPLPAPVIATAPPVVAAQPVAPTQAEPEGAKPAAPAILARRPPLPVRRLPAAAPPTRAADAAQAALEAPVLTLPPAPPPPPPPAPAPETLPFKPDAAPDPNAPIVTHRPYG